MNATDKPWIHSINFFKWRSKFFCFFCGKLIINNIDDVFSIYSFLNCHFIIILIILKVSNGWIIMNFNFFFSLIHIHCCYIYAIYYEFHLTGTMIIIKKNYSFKSNLCESSFLVGKFIFIFIWANTLQAAAYK